MQPSCIIHGHLRQGVELGIDLALYTYSPVWSQIGANPARLFFFFGSGITPGDLDHVGLKASLDLKTIQPSSHGMKLKLTIPVYLSQLQAESDQMSLCRAPKAGSMVQKHVNGSVESQAGYSVPHQPVSVLALPMWLSTMQNYLDVPVPQRST